VEPAGKHEEPLRYLSTFLPGEPDAPILDAACGNGRFALALANRGFRQIVGIDLFEKLDTQRRFDYLRRPMDDTGLEGGQFAVVYCFSAVYYLPNPETALREFFRLLRPGGVVVLSAHTRHSLFTLERVALRRLRVIRHLDGVSFHSPWAYCEMARRAGFEVLDVDGYGLVYSPANLFVRVLNRLPRLASAAGPWPARPDWVKTL